ncbi:hypothetical protein D3C84_948340 [compost metagenome]
MIHLISSVINPPSTAALKPHIRPIKRTNINTRGSHTLAMRCSQSVSFFSVTWDDFQFDSNFAFPYVVLEGVTSRTNGTELGVFVIFSFVLFVFNSLTSISSSVIRFSKRSRRSSWLKGVAPFLIMFVNDVIPNYTRYMSDKVSTSFM